MTCAQPAIQKPIPTEHTQQVAEFQRELNAEFTDPARSPLSAEARRSFAGLPFYPTDYAACVLARFVPDSLGPVFAMPTSTAKRLLYRKYGELHFELSGQPRRLVMYQSLDLLTNPAYRDYLFVPFTDRTNGHGSYGGGRYLDFRRGQIRGGHVVLDFNRAYNPSCAYAAGYDCPVPPAENRLTVHVEAGIRHDH
ncbi:DUF1684 domain-containing protein [Hymenobacter lapidiphilus]|uniref:DUF1684 domain-containing protein n=1 Tax=Hymenobacter lapidiphilus TaxID=2608003 RepID=A0A7Y7U4Y2_9BACT|nr:DUF1684 domain-containing protein [Hymenobacter lapidiphilus]NVO30883.1 DUF1684 domain-containing protein [Hymenobacter lapidiphilus]